MPLVFVYGTLMRAGANHAVLQRLGARFLGDATTREPRTLVDLGPYPALLPHAATPSSASVVSGELWELDDTRLCELDAFEGYPDLYGRERITVDLAANASHEAFVYVLARRPPAHAVVIATGRYATSGTVLPEGATPEQIEEEPKRKR